ncbi:MAG: aldo/keto reductase [Sedimentisphaerales bacterium]|nr:aldo/keto reductase [Sedimentisphaerales bacterium]
MRMKRREFLTRSIAGAGGLLLGSHLAPGATPKNGMYNPYELVRLGSTKIKVSRVGLGTGMRGGGRQSNHTRMGHEKFDALARGCYERGIRLFDVADLYGTQPFLAEALKELPRKDYAISTKIWWRPGGIPEKERDPADVLIERFLKELNTDYIDLVLLHCVESEKWPTELSGYMNTLAKLKKKGLIRAHGLSCHSLEALQSCVGESWVDSVHARINPFAVKMDVRQVEDVPKVAAVLKALRKEGKAVIGMKILGEGTFRDSDEKRDKSIKYALESGCMDAMVVGFEKINEIDDFAARVRRVPLKADASMAQARQSVRVA